jgi:uncharacterized repeat protein (TIGR04002 family)
MKKDFVRKLALSGMMGALILLFTAWLHIPVGKGYVHIGDGFLYLAAVTLPTPYALLVGIGAPALADCLSGFALWAPGTMVIKGLTVLLFTAKGKKLLCLRNLIAPIFAGVLCAGGYYLYEALLYGDYHAPLLSVPGNLIQSLCSAVVFYVLGAALASGFRKSITG